MLIAGPRSQELQTLLVKYTSLMVIDHAIQRLYARIRTLNNTLLKCHSIILERRSQTASRMNARGMINEAGTHLVLLWTMMQNLMR